ncbi:MULTISPECIES: MCE family protein [Mycobacteriaceae]|uniref:MCE-family protein MCE3A n=1 Tax=Mycolicibacterium neoaurum VKM Ac-1815D TaxID=700508 RepID=V5XCR1_MYCNE|nr:MULTISPECIES: MCE family protein [Mycobacteriaceae]AHC25588.1 MCE-family protein MCE3A [Mycolicibacterium neoaurum VKM Ac-1815D]AMO06040.1 MCE-family protein MCE3A [Mycolicibacterium neoaurum]AXK75623.1 MCE family protein [Mycolicibacterium neoaurum]KJQ50449.1 MCE-family protein MCE3A [Mycolicibacterium neoaurum]KUM09630.1 MCE-family protein MCE3A [Mycolicibacterium neoaurum]
MDVVRGKPRIANAWWSLILFFAVVALVFVTVTSFRGTFRSVVPVTLTADRTGLVMETGAKVKLRGIDVGRVSQISSKGAGAQLKLDIDSDQIRYIPENIEARIAVTTIFGAKFVDLVYPSNPSGQRLAAGAALRSTNVTTEVNTVFENVVDLLDMVDPLKLNAVLTAVADAVRGKGEKIGAATTDLNEVLTALNSRSDIFREDIRALKNLGDTYSAAAEDIVSILDAVSTTGTTVVDHKDALDTLLLNAIGVSEAGSNLLVSSKDNLVTAINSLEPTIELLNMYSPAYACTLQGAQWIIDNGKGVFGGDGRTFVVDVALLPGNDPYSFPENLPVVAAKGGPGGRPGCGSLPDATKNFPVRQLITNTGWGTGLDIRPNPGIGRPCYANYLPVTRAVPEPPSIRQCLPGPAPGPQPYPGAPPYGAALYGPGGVPLWPGIPPAAPAATSPATAGQGGPP